MTIRPLRILLHTVILLSVILTPVAFDLGPGVEAQVPTASDSPRYVMPPKAISSGVALKL